MLDVRSPHEPTHTWSIVLVALVATLNLFGCFRPIAPPALVGTWLVDMPTAPYPYHSHFPYRQYRHPIKPRRWRPWDTDSNLMGARTSAGDGFTAKLVETSADRTTHKFVSRAELVMSIHLQSNSLHGTGTASVFDATGKLDGTPHPFTFQGDRILP